jgi:hypothetical protein
LRRLRFSRSAAAKRAPRPARCVFFEDSAIKHRPDADFRAEAVTRPGPRPDPGVNLRAPAPYGKDRRGPEPLDLIALWPAALP